jgi:hypothetical protein
MPETKARHTVWSYQAFRASDDLDAQVERAKSPWSKLNTFRSFGTWSSKLNNSLDKSHRHIVFD